MTEPTRELTPEERKRGERLLRRADALSTAYWMVEKSRYMVLHKPPSSHLGSTQKKARRE